MAALNVDLTLNIDVMPFVILAKVMNLLALNVGLALIMKVVQVIIYQAICSLKR